MARRPPNWGTPWNSVRPDRRNSDGHPPLLKPSRIPLVIVCGPPCSGKTTYVVERAGANDLVIDLDTIASRLAGTTTHAWRRDDWLTLALQERNQLLIELGNELSVHSRAWLIVGEPDATKRDWWATQLRPERIVVIETDRDTCLDRLFADPERKTNRSATTVAIEGWWQRYSRRTGDEVVRQ